MSGDQHVHPAVRARLEREYAKAVKEAEEAVASARASYAEHPAQLAAAFSSLGKLRQRHSDFSQAEEAFKQALAIRETSPSDATELAAALRELARMYDAAGQAGECRPLMQRAARIESEAFRSTAPPPELEVSGLEYSSHADFVENMAGSAPKTFWTQNLGGLVLPLSPLLAGLTFVVRGRVAIYGHRGHMFVHGPLIVEGAAARMWGMAWLCAAAFAHFHFFWPYRNRTLCSYGKAISFVVGALMLFLALAKIWMS